MLRDVIKADYKSDYKIEIFKNFKINDELGIITWENEIDIAPERLYCEATGSKPPAWTKQ